MTCEDTKRCDRSDMLGSALGSGFGTAYMCCLAALGVLCILIVFCDSSLGGVPG